MSRAPILAAIAASALTLVAMLAWQHHSSTPDKDHGARVEAKPQTPQDDDKRPGVVLDKEALEQAGIQTSPATRALVQAQSQAIATVLSTQELLDSAASIAAAKAQAVRASAALDASRRDYERIKGLHTLDRNVSDRALEAAEATWRGDDASARAAQEALAIAQATAQSRWGQALVALMAAHGGPWQRLAAGQTLLLRVVASTGASTSALPTAIEVDDASGELRQAHWLSVAPTVDAHIQGRAFFYVMDAHGAAPGMVLEARFNAGQQVPGAMLPADALLWWQGKQWAYVEVSPGHFERREASAAGRQDKGWFVPGFEAATVVSRGAQALLSQELRSAIKVGEEE